MLATTAQRTASLLKATGVRSSLRLVSSLTPASKEVDIENYRGEWKTYGDAENYKAGKFQIKTFNKISPVGLEKFDGELYDVRNDGEQAANAHAILMRSHKLKEEEVKHTVRAIARCGAGTNNIPVDRMTELGIPVFNTPGANANAVKELVLCGLFLGSRRVVDGINHMEELGKQGLAKERVEKDKAMFGGRELAGKTLAVIGLGHIGASTARDAARIGMNIIGYDPALSVESALKLPRHKISLAESIVAAVADADYISINIPFIKGSPSTGGTQGIISKDVLQHFKKDAVLLNFARGELVDSAAMKNFLDSSDGARYISDFPDDLLWDHKNAILLPHLGASTEEAEDSAASMAADTIRSFLETGTIVNSVNFPATSLASRPQNTVRFAIVNKNSPGVLGRMLDYFGKANLNIVQEVNHSKGSIAYTVMDIDISEGKDVIDLKIVQEEITMLEDVLSSRIIFGEAGKGYAKNVEGEYFV